MKELVILASALMSQQRHMRERNQRLIRAKPFRKDNEDYFVLMYVE